MSSLDAPAVADGSIADDDVDRFRDCVERLRVCPDLSPYLYASSPSEADAFAAIEPACAAMAQTVATLITRLDALADPTYARQHTPREALLELVDIVRHALCLAMQHYADGPSDPSREAMRATFNAHAAVRQVPIEAVVEGLHSVGYISAKLRLEKVVLQLQRRLQAELHARGWLAEDGSLLDAPVTGSGDATSSSEALASDASTAALHITYTLLDDFQRLFENTLRLLDAEGQTGAFLLTAARREYYRLTDWILLAESATEVPAVSFTTIHKVQLDLAKGEARFLVRRATRETPWGLLFNDKGRLIDVDVAVRGRKGARDLHQLLRCAVDGARVVAINDEALSDEQDELADPTEEAARTAAEQHRVLMALRAASTGARTRMQVTIQSPHFRQAEIMGSHVATFTIPFQGSEWAGGQCAMLVMQRRRPNAALPVQLDAALRVVPLETLQGLPEQFLARVGDRVRVLAVNGVEVFSLAQAQALMADTDTVMMTLVMTAPPGLVATPGARRLQHAPLLPAAPRSTPLRKAVVVAPLKAAALAAAVDSVAEILTADIEEAVEDATEETVDDAVEAVEEANDEVVEDAIEEATEEAIVEAVEEAIEDAADEAIEETEAIELQDPMGEEEVDTEEAVPIEEVTVEEDVELVDAVEPLVALTTKAELLVKKSKQKVSGAGKRKKNLAKDVVSENTLVNNILREFALEEDGSKPAATPEKLPKDRKKRAKQSSKAAEPVVDEATVLASIAEEIAAEDGTATTTSKRGPKAAGKTSKTSKRSASTSTGCAFENGVKVLELTNKTIVLQRPSTAHPWGIEGEMASHSTDFPAATGFRMTKLPSKPLVADHPFLRKFEAAPPTWYVAGINQLSAKGKTGEFVVQKMRQLKKMTLHIIHK